MYLVSGNKRFEQKLLSVRIPVKYLELQNRIIAEATYYRRHKEKGPPILSWDEIIKCVTIIIKIIILQLCRLGNECNFKEENELTVAIKYVIRQG